MRDSGSTNTIDQLLRHTKGPEVPIDDRDLTRARSSAFIVHGNFRDIVELCDDIQTGVIVATAETDNTDVENEVYRRVHNYVTSLYSYNEQIRSILNDHLNQHIGKRYFLPARDERSAPEYVQKGAFLWGLRNDFQHGDYWCLSVQRERTDDGTSNYSLQFDKQSFNATPKGNIDSAGDYLAHASDDKLRYPLPYIGEFHRNLFNEFENDFERWCG